MLTLERLAWQLGISLTRHQRPAAAEAFLARARRRLIALSSEDPTQTGGTSLKFLKGAVAALLALALAATRRSSSKQGKTARASGATTWRLRLGVVLALAVGPTAAKPFDSPTASPDYPLYSPNSPDSPVYKPELGPLHGPAAAGAQPFVAPNIELNPPQVQDDLGYDLQLNVLEVAAAIAATHVTAAAATASPAAAAVAACRTARRGSK